MESFNDYKERQTDKVTHYWDEKKEELDNKIMALAKFLQPTLAIHGAGDLHNKEIQTLGVIEIFEKLQDSFFQGAYDEVKIALERDLREIKWE
jgi:16S rRNA G1207 methylase RsmC